MNSITYPAWSCEELDGKDFQLDYLIDGCLVKGQPCIVAGPPKSLKTSALLDLAISLATGTQWLGKFTVPTPKRVGFMSGESGMGTICDTARRICQSKGLDFQNVSGLFFSDKLPQFGSYEHHDAMRDYITANALEAVVIDPAYLCMPGTDAANLMRQGELLRGMTSVCQESGCTLILVHHTSKGSVSTKPPQLGDIAWAGFSEFARQWILLGRYKLYVPGSGQHALWLTVGGSAGHSGLWGLDIDEGNQADGRKWAVAVREGDTVKQEKSERNHNSGRKTHNPQDDKTKILNALRKFPKGETFTKIRSKTKLHTDRVTAALESLTADGTVVECEVHKSGRSHDGFQLYTDFTGNGDKTPFNPHSNPVPLTGITGDSGNREYKNSRSQSRYPEPVCEW